MKKIQILLSSALTVLLITSNNAYAAFAISNAVFADQPNKNNSVRFNQKRNRLGDDISGYGYRNILKKGDVFKGNVRVLPRNGAFIGVPPDPKFNPPKQGYTDSGRITYIRSGKDDFLNEATIYQNGKDRFIGETGLSDDTHLGSAIGIPPEPELRSDNNLLPAVQVNNYNCKDVSGNCIDKSSPKFGGQEGQSLDKSTPKFSGQKGGAITNTPTIYENVGETGFIGQTGGVALEHGPGISGDLRNSNTGTIDPISKEEKPRTSVQLKFIEGAWREIGEATPLNPATP